jgi:uncharacterized pyridoxamine 5'-phosphate oxidase family protein
MMNEVFEKAVSVLNKEIGQDKIMALATRKEDGVASRTVNVYTFNGCFYFVTEADSNKYKQILQNDRVALSVDAIQITGQAIMLEHPCDEENGEIVHFIEEQLPKQFARYQENPIMRLIQIVPDFASFILLDTGEGYCITYKEKTAEPVKINR